MECDKGIHCVPQSERDSYYSAYFSALYIARKSPQIKS